MWVDIPSNIIKIVAPLGLALVLAIAGTAAPKIATLSIGEQGTAYQISYGLWKAVTEQSSGGVTQSTSYDHE